MNLTSCIMSYDKTKVNQENCNCEECVSAENVKLENQINCYSLSEDEIERIILERYSDKDKKTKEFIIKFLRKNGDLYDLSDTLYINKRTKIKIICKKHGDVIKYPTNFLKSNTICDLCKLEEIIKTFIKNSKLKYGENAIDYSEMNYIDSKTNIKLICKKHNISFDVTPNHHLNTNIGCPLCGKESYKKLRSKTLEQFLIEISKIPKYKDYDFSESIYNGYDNLMKVKCKKHGYFTTTPHRLLNGEGCRFCGIESSAKTRTKSVDYFLQISHEVQGDDYDYSYMNYVNLSTEILIKCKKCGKFFMQKPFLHLRGHGCSDCNNLKGIECRKTTFEKFVEISTEEHGEDMYEYFESKYKSYLEETLIKCKTCGKFFTQIARNHAVGCGCIYCNSSKGENKIIKILDKFNYEFLFQYRFEDCRDKIPLIFDFYIPNYNLCIEFDGEQHFKKVNWTGKMAEEQMEENLKSNQLRDKIKNDYCKNNKINLLRIKYDEDIEEKLTEYFKILNKIGRAHV